MKQQSSIFLLAKATTQLEEKLQAINHGIIEEVKIKIEEYDRENGDPRLIFKREMESLSQAFRCCKVKTGDLMKGIEASRRSLRITTEIQKGKLKVTNMQRNIEDFRDNLKQKAIKRGCGDPDYLNFPDFLLVKSLNKQLDCERETVKHLENELRQCQFKLLKIRAAITKSASEDTEKIVDQLEK